MGSAPGQRYICGTGARDEEIRNPNIETRNNIEVLIRKPQTAWFGISCSSFGFVSDFDIPISDFFALAAHHLLLTNLCQVAVFEQDEAEQKGYDGVGHRVQSHVESVKSIRHRRQGNVATHS